MLNTELKFSYNDVVVEPAAISHIDSRSECNPYRNIDDKDYLPIFTAPMSSVINYKNSKLFNDNHIIPIIPRSDHSKVRFNILENHNEWVAVSLKEFYTWFVQRFDHKKQFEKFLIKDDCREVNPNPEKPYKVLIDIANGHMKSLYDIIKLAKSHYGQNLIIMTGNIANPATYMYAWAAGVDYIRLGIGTGAGCITSSNTSIHYPIASLITNTVNKRELILKAFNYYQNELSSDLENIIIDNNMITIRDLMNIDPPKIIADGGIRNYSDVIKALALGADYVMIGGLFSSCIESAAKTYIKNYYTSPTSETPWDRYDEYDSKDPVMKNEYKNFISGKGSRHTFYKKFYGMASKEGQIDLNGQKTHTSEGIAKYVQVKFNLAQWTENMADYLRSAMSYTGHKNLNTFIKDTKCNIISNNTYNSVNK